MAEGALTMRRQYQVLYADCSGWSEAFEADDALAALQEYFKPDWAVRHNIDATTGTRNPKFTKLRIVRVVTTQELIAFEYVNGRYR